MSAVEAAIEAVYTSIHNDNEDIDGCIKSLKAALLAEGKKEAVFEQGRLAMNNRQGRKMMQTYFKKRGVIVKFMAAENAVEP
jgi:hypothetical protein